jgi:hypothetical protein
MCIIKALDQERVDIKNNKKLMQRIHSATKQELKAHKDMQKQVQQVPEPASLTKAATANTLTTMAEGQPLQSSESAALSANKTP